MIETATYQSSIHGFCEHLKVDVNRARELLRLCVAVAQESRDDFWEKYRKNNSERDETRTNPDEEFREKPLVAGSIGPYGAYFHDGSEYTGSYASSMSIEELMDWHRPRMSCLVEAGADLLAIETVPAAKEARALARLLREHPNVKAWISFSCSEPLKLCNGDGLAATASLCCEEAPNEQLVGVGVNCVPPETAHESIVALASVARPRPLDVIAYPNSGEKWIAGTGWVSTADIRTPHSYVPLWLSSGADWIGGCCRVTADEICRIKQAVVEVRNKSKARLASS